MNETVLAVCNKMCMGLNGELDTVFIDEGEFCLIYTDSLFKLPGTDAFSQAVIITHRGERLTVVYDNFTEFVQI